MCGRFEPPDDPHKLKIYFGLYDDFMLPARSECCPTDDAPIIKSINGQRHLSFARFGLIPSWWSQPKPPASTFNARSETVAEKPMFRTPFRRQRCLVPMASFFEWRAVPGATKKQKYRITRADGEPLAVAGLWDWHAGAGEGDPGFESMTLLTCEPNDVMEPIHNRMPVVLASEDWTIWLAPEQHPELLRQLLKPCPSDSLRVDAA